MKKKNIKEKYLKLKELWKHPKYHALILLGFYFVFFAIISFFIRTSNNTSKVNYNIEEDEINILDKYYQMDNYEYEAEIIVSGTINDNNLIKGIKYNDLNEFEDEKTHQKYYFKESNIYDKLTNELVVQNYYVNLNSIKNTNIYSLIKEKVETNKLEYNDGLTKKEYNLNNIVFSDVETENLNIITYEDNNYINKVEIMFTYNSNYYHIEINYTNINNISNYSSN